MLGSRKGLVAVLLLAFIPATAVADLKHVDRAIKKEPAYKSKSPRYALLVFGAEAKDRVWLVHDGDTLYVDRHGDGDLTRPEAKVMVDPHSPETSKEYPEYVTRYMVGDLGAAACTRT